jgi:hypothetical protein
MPAIGRELAWLSLGIALLATQHVLRVSLSASTGIAWVQSVQGLLAALIPADEELTHFRAAKSEAEIHEQQYASQSLFILRLVS